MTARDVDTLTGYARNLETAIADLKTRTLALIDRLPSPRPWEADAADRDLLLTAADELDRLEHELALLLADLEHTARAGSRAIS